MHTPDDPTSTAKRSQTWTHPGTISATQTCTVNILHNKGGNKKDRTAKALLTTEALVEVCELTIGALAKVRHTTQH